MKKFLTIIVTGLLWCNILPAKILNIENQILLEVPSSHEYIEYDNEETMEFIEEATDLFEGFEIKIFLVGPRNYIEFEKAMLDGEDMMENKYVKSIAHPTGRLIQKRPAYEADMEKIFDKAKETNTSLEINSFPVRLDLNDKHVRNALNAGVKLTINTDAHNTGHLEFMGFGISTARRGWAEKKDVLNTLPLKKFLKSLK